MKDGMTILANRTQNRKVNRPILYWQAWFGNAVIDENNSIALLRHKWKGQPGVTFRSVR